MNKVGQIMRTCWKELIIALFMVFVGYELHATRSELRSIKQDVSSTNQALTSRFWDRPSMEAAPHPIKWDMSSIGTDVSSTSKADINSINSQAGSMQSDVSSIKRDVSAIRRDLGAIKTDLSAIKRDVSEIKRRIGY